MLTPSSDGLAAYGPLIVQVGTLPRKSSTYAVLACGSLVKPQPRPLLRGQQGAGVHPVQPHLARPGWGQGLGRRRRRPLRGRRAAGGQHAGHEREQEAHAATLSPYGGAVRVAVVGAGVVGMSTTAALLDAGVEAVCFERSGAVMAERSAGSSRIFRLAHADPDLVRLAGRAREGFARWAERAGTPMVDRCGCVVSGGDAADRAAAMTTAGAAFELVEPGSDRLHLPATVTAEPVLLDPEGGVVDVDAVRAFLVARAGHAVVRDARRDRRDHRAPAPPCGPEAGDGEFDAVVLAAGAGTSALAAQVGIATPSALVHHFRVTFPIAEARRPSWIDNPADGLPTYQHRSGPGRWSVGGTVDPALVAWEVGRDAAVAASREVLLAYARERLAVEPRIVDGLYCTHVPDAGDGITFRRSGPVLAVDGDNLMKFAPVLGESLAAAAVDGSTPGGAASSSTR